MTKGLGMALTMYSSCLPMFNGRRTFRYDSTKYKGDKELADILKKKAKQRRNSGKWMKKLLDIWTVAMLYYMMK